MPSIGINCCYSGWKLLSYLSLLYMLNYPFNKSELKTVVSLKHYSYLQFDVAREKKKYNEMA